MTPAVKVHLVGMPHLDPVRQVEWCAFSQKTRRLCDMLTGQGHEVIYYGGPQLGAQVAEHVPIVTSIARRRWFGDETWAETVFNHWDPAEPCWAEMNLSAVAAISARLEPHDIIGLTMGRCQQAIYDAFPNHVRAEVGIGYDGPILGSHWCVESEAHRHYLYGKNGITDGRLYDTVIPNAFDPDDYDFRTVKDEYLLFMGRMTARKGLRIVAELAKTHTVLTGGQGDERVPGAEHVGVVTGDDKRKLLAGAWAVLTPTTYIEPFGGVAVEAMLSGTPVISTPFGAFSETVEQGVTGYRCSTLADFRLAVEIAGDLDPCEIRDRARRRFSTAVVAPQYSRWLERLGTLYGRGWYS